MESIPQKAISKMRQALDEMDILPAKKTEVGLLLDRVEAKGGMAEKELKELDKIMEAEEKQIKGEIISAKRARAATSKFIRKTDKIFQNYLTALKK